MSTKNPLDEIKKHQEAINNLKEEAVKALRSEKNNLQDRINAIDDEIEELTGKAPTAKASGRTRKTITVEEVIDSIKAGNKNYPAIAKHLGVSPANVAKKVKEAGKAITKKGERATMELSVK